MTELTQESSVDNREFGCATSLMRKMIKMTLINNVPKLSQVLIRMKQNLNWKSKAEQKVAARKVQ